MPNRFLLMALVVVGSAAIAAERPIDFNRDVRPILSDTCFACHGPDAAQRTTELRLDMRDSAVAKLESENVAIVPGDPAASELIRRLTTDDEFSKMPPAETNKHVTPQQVEILRRWIAEGAEYKPHWAYLPPHRPTLPSVSNPAWLSNPIDAFALAKLDGVGLAPNSETDKPTLLRRVTLDLTGLPPTPEELDAFLADTSPEAYGRAVDRLLASPRYGEHQAHMWLDAVRYGDTHGLHLDNERSMWPYRDWVIEAFNANQPFDRFTVEQVAGDLLPTPSLDQLVASGYNRCNVTTSEGGSINEEVRVRYVIDRTEAIGTVFLGLTVGCAVCHDHKFDPVSQKEFYALSAYYNSTADPAMDGNILLTPPVMPVPSPTQIADREALTTALAQASEDYKSFVAALDYGPLPTAAATPAPPTTAELVWWEDDLPPGAAATAQGDAIPGWRFVGKDAGPVFSGERSAVRTSDGLAQHYFTEAKPGLTVQAGDVLFAYVYLDPAKTPESIMLQFNLAGSWEHRAYWGSGAIPFGADNTPAKLRRGDLPEKDRWVRLEVPVEAVGLKPGDTLNGMAFTQYGGTVHWDHAGLLTVDPAFQAARVALGVWEPQATGFKDRLPEPVRAVLDTPTGTRTDAQKSLLEDYFARVVFPLLEPQQTAFTAERDRVTALLAALEKEIPSTLIMRDEPSVRQAFVLNRGQYDQQGDKVAPGVPAFLPALPQDAAPNRLTLANWLIQPEHPLTARVTVNRLWQRYFGTGIVKTSEDFGSQGDWPSHPDLLDWLAVEFIDSGWNLKAMHRLIVTSAVYRQSSRVTPEKLEADPTNRLLSRGPRFRLDAEVLRDSALAASGLLVERVGGESVKPYQPPGIWEVVGYTRSNTANFVQDHGPKLYRRGVYTFWKRTAPPPMLQTFDAPSRESCTVRRPRTNTPLQALALMNDTQLVEAARHMAARAATHGETDDERLTYAYRLATSRRPTATELDVLRQALTAMRTKYAADPDAATALLAVGESPRNESLTPAEHAAWTVLCNLLLNLDEAVSKS